MGEGWGEGKCNNVPLKIGTQLKVVLISIGSFDI
jgi:hypothetical protein